MEKGTQRAQSSRQQDALALLGADHQKVQKLFKDFKKLNTGRAVERAGLVKMVCDELTIHSRIEEEIFYPAVREATGEADLLDEAEVEHACIKDLVEQLESMDPGKDLYDATFTVLAENVTHHITEEEDELFPKVKQSDLDLVALAEQLRELKEELKAQLSSISPIDEDDEEDDDEEDVRAVAGRH
ncbi:MAG: hemerythrin domain-containing protein [Candidatus Accumulibacter sp. UW20]|jgi:hemerythrin superfamily protein